MERVVNAVRQIALLLVSLLTALMLGSCSSSTTPAKTTLFVNGSIYLDADTKVSNLLVKDGIVAGIDVDPKEYQQAEVVDLQGATAYPGFNDSHVHLISMAVAGSIMASTGTETDPVKMAQLVGAKCRNVPPGTQVLSQGLGPQYDIPGFMRYNQVMNLARVVVAFASIPYWKWLGAWIEKNAKPLPISICPSYVHEGGGLAVAPSPYDFGQKGMQMALKWVAARKGAAPPPVSSSPHFTVGIRQSLLAARGITMPPIYIEAARIGEAYFP